jgi:hypothetical protein
MAEPIQVNVPIVPKLSTNASMTDIVNAINQIQNTILQISGQKMPLNNLSTTQVGYPTNGNGATPTQGGISPVGGMTMARANNTRAVNAQPSNPYNQALGQRKSAQYQIERVTEKVRLTNPDDKEQYVDVLRINKLVMRNENTGELWVWERLG